jgi:superfamily II DNA/RNA helicase
MTTFDNKFSKFQLAPDILEALTLLRYTEPTEIQSLVIPAALAGKDVVGKSKTGTGKTAAFAIPICEKVVWEENLPQALVLEPTRELAVQVKTEIFHIGRKKRLKVPVLFGGMPVDKQALTLKQKSHIVVGTPGRIMDHVRRETLNLSNIRYLVIDESDLMLNMGFLEEVEQIIRLLPSKRVTMLFSATVDKAVQELVDQYMTDPLSITLESTTETVSEISQELYYTDNEKKYALLMSLLIQENPKDCMIFCATREMVNTLYHKLCRDKVKCGMLHGELDQKERLQTIEDFRDGRFHFLICTDVAARGIDFDHITHVINYDFPTGKETYVHRIGRTGRNGNTGKAISLVTPEEKKMKQAVVEYTSQPIEEKLCPDRDTLDAEAFWKKQKEKTVLKKRKGAVFQKTITRLSIGGGRKSKMRAVDIVGSICSIEGITAEDIGIIDVRDSLTYVEILNDKGKTVLDALQDKTIKGKIRKVRITKSL